MTATTVISATGQATVRPKMIVVAEEEVYGFLTTAGLGVDFERRCRSVADLWAGLACGDIDDTATLLLFSDAAADDRDALAHALATMAPHATVFLLSWAPETLADLTDRYLAVASAHPDQCDPDAPVHVITPPISGEQILTALRARLTPNVYVPATEPTWSAPLTAAGRSGTNGAPGVASPSPPAVRATPRDSDATAEHGVAAYPQLPEIPDEPSPAPTGVARTIAVHSSKGGSGKTTTAVALAGALARQHPQLRICLVDLDIYDGQVATILNTYMPTAMSVRLDPRGVTDDSVMSNLVTHRRLGINALLAPVKAHNADDLTPEWYRSVLAVLRRHHDIVILDCSVSYLHPLLSNVALPEADVILTVTTLAVTSLAGMARMLHALTDDADTAGLAMPKEKFGIVVNGAMNGVHVERQRVLEGSLGIPIVGVVPHAARDVMIATNNYTPHRLLDHPDLGAAYRELAEKVYQTAGHPVAPAPATVTRRRRWPWMARSVEVNA